MAWTISDFTYTILLQTIIVLLTHALCNDNWLSKSPSSLQQSLWNHLLQSSILVPNMHLWLLLLLPPHHFNYQTWVSNTWTINHSIAHSRILFTICLLTHRYSSPAIPTSPSLFKEWSIISVCNHIVKPLQLSLHIAINPPFPAKQHKA